VKELSKYMSLWKFHQVKDVSYQISVLNFGKFCSVWFKNRIRQ